MSDGGRETVYEGPLFAVVREREGDQEVDVVEHPGSVTVLAVDRDGCISLVRQHRTPAGRALLELPAGKIEPGEDPLETARRELQEETGLRGGDWREVVSFWTTPGFVREHMRLFVAEGVEPGEASPEPDEEVEIVRWQVDEVAGRLAEIEDGKTLVGLLLVLAGEVRLRRRP
jgi:ADP-ribose pyrophosphatase